MPDIKTKSLDAAPGQVKVWKARLVESGRRLTLIASRSLLPPPRTRDGDEFSLCRPTVDARRGSRAQGPASNLDHGFRESGARLYGGSIMLGA